MRVTQDDLLDALRTALATVQDGDGQTVQEMCAATGKHEKPVRNALRAIAAEGRLEVVRVQRVALDGTPRWVPAYRIKPKAKGAKAA